MGKCSLSTCACAHGHSAKVLIGDLRPPQNQAASGIAFQKTDVTRWVDLLQLFKKAKNDFGSIDMVCANVRMYVLFCWLICI